MAQHEYTDYQKDVISSYYKNLDTIMLDKLSEVVSELYLADSQTKAERLWQKVHKAMINLKIPEVIINNIIGKKDIQILAKNLQEWQSKSR